MISFDLDPDTLRLIAETFDGATEPIHFEISDGMLTVEGFVGDSARGLVLPRKDV